MAKLWFYNWFAQDVGEYLIKLNEILLAGLDQKMFDIEWMEGYF